MENKKNSTHLFMDKRVVLIGAGNVGHHLAQALLSNGINLCQIYSRTASSAIELSKKTGITYTTNMKMVYPDCDIYIFAVSDDSIEELCKELYCKEDALILHTCGSVPMDTLCVTERAHGVLYPLQTFTKKRELDFREIPLLIEASDTNSFQVVEQLAQILSDNVVAMTSEDRRKVHLGAVMVNNFTNHLYELAGNYLQSQDIDGKLLRPLIYETAHKVMSMTPHEAQTGPAKRGDKRVLQMHMDLLQSKEELLKVYTLFTDSIEKSFAGQQTSSEPKGPKPGEMLTLW
ncbi:MAG: Rossmann-like and DUF2520 domain-containing protein [Marinifilaceae bacterium]